MLSSAVYTLNSFFPLVVCSHSLAYPGEGFPPLHVVAFLLFGLAACGPLAASKLTTGGCSQSSKSDSDESSLWISFKADDTPLVLNDAPSSLLYNREMNLHEVLILLATASVHYTVDCEYFMLKIFCWKMSLYVIFVADNLYHIRLYSQMNNSCF